MDKIAKGQKNKGFLWQLLYENKVFDSIPENTY